MCGGGGRGLPCLLIAVSVASISVHWQENAKLLHRLVSKEQSKADALHKVKLRFVGADPFKPTLSESHTTLHVMCVCVCHTSWEGTGPGHDEAMAALFAKIAEAYAACGFQATAHPEPLHMLAAIEVRFQMIRVLLRDDSAARSTEQDGSAATKHEGHGSCGSRVRRQAREGTGTIAARKVPRGQGQGAG